tara:strand:- start:2692 stop:3558 length:867 start_codon:yes stop_codon:yes gene_type:complete
LSSKFNNVQLEIENEPCVQEYEVKNLDFSGNVEIEEFELQKLREQGRGGYENIRKKFGPIAASDPERVIKGKKASRFKMSKLLRNSLDVEDEEKKYLDKKVKDQIGLIKQQAVSQSKIEGFEKGFESGKVEAIKEFQEANKETIDRINNFVNAIEHSKDLIYQENEKFLIDLIFKVSKMILLKELETDREFIQRVCHELVTRVNVKDFIKVKVNPDDEKELEVLSEALNKDFKDIENITLEISDDIDRYDVIVETKLNAIESRIDDELNRIRNSVLGITENRSEEDVE